MNPTIGSAAFYKRGDSYQVMPVTGNDGGMIAGGYLDLGGLQGYKDSLNSDLAYYKSIQPLVHDGVMLLKRPDGSNYGESHYRGPDPTTQIQALQAKIDEANAGQGMFAPDYNNGAKVINGNYTEKASIDQTAANEAAVANGTMTKIMQNGVAFYLPKNAAPFVQGSQPGSDPGQSLGKLSLVDPSRVPNAPPGYSNASISNISANTPQMPGANLQPGDKSDTVAQLQKYLISQGMSIPSIQNGTATPGYYGPETQAAVSALQQKLGVAVPKGQEGFWGPLTQGAVTAAAQKAQASQTPTSPSDNSTYKSTGDPKMDAAFASLKGIYDKILSSGAYTPNANINITPELVSKFLAEAHQVVDPYTQQTLTDNIKGINAALQNTATQYQTQRDQTTQDFQTNLATSREADSGNGVAFSGLRGLNEANAVATTNRNLSSLDSTYANNIGNTLRTGGAVVGNGINGMNGSTNDFITPQLNGAQVSTDGARGSVGLGGALSYNYDPSIYKIGSIGSAYNSSLLGQSNQFLSDYQKSANNNGRTFQNLNGTPTLY